MKEKFTTDELKEVLEYLFDGDGVRLDTNLKFAVYQKGGVRLVFRKHVPLMESPHIPRYNVNGIEIMDLEHDSIISGCLDLNKMEPVEEKTKVLNEVRGK